MTTLTYTGPAGLRVIEGCEFTHGVPTDVPAKAARAILAGPHADEFTETKQTTADAKTGAATTTKED